MRRFLLAAIALLPVFALAAEPLPPSRSTPAEELTVAPGFKAELLRSAGPDEGSWICMTIDEKGRLYISEQGRKPASGTKAAAEPGLWRVTLDARGQVAQWERVPVPITDAMGMLWAFDSLYVSGLGPEGRAIYRLKDSKGTDTLDAWTIFKRIPGGDGEHGAHALVLGPDRKSIYIVNGNVTPLVEGITPDSPYRNYTEEDLLPRVMDPVGGISAKVKSPYGGIFKTDEAGAKWEFFAGGLRNPYDIAFNPDGELFTFDSDSERDIGTPWYRPTRILHLVRGGEYGFREGTAKWPAYYADSLPPVVEIGLGCPTGVMFGTASNFPDKYRKAFFVLDWTFGRILAIHLRPKGASYTARNTVPPYRLADPLKSDDVEEFLRGKGMPVTALQFGKDGAMYFTVGGRGTQAALYRVSWVGSAAEAAKLIEPVSHNPVEPSSAREFRRELESPDKQVPHLQSERRTQAVESFDRFIYFAARLRAEHLPLDQLRQLALQDPRVDQAHSEELIFPGETPTARVRNVPHAKAVDGLMGLLALARMGTKEDQELVLNALGKYPLDSLDEELKLVKLRILEVSFIRQGRPSTEFVHMAIEKLGRHYPAVSFPLNRELCQLLVYLDAPDVVEKTLTLMDKSEEPAEQMWYVLCLREATNWTPAQREHYFAWFSKMQDYHGGGSSKKFLVKMRDLALEKAPEAERPALLALAEKTVEKPNPGPVIPARPFVKAWTLADLEPVLAGVNKGRDFARGKQLFADLLCAQCHQFAGGGGLAKGGAVGPDLSAVGSRFGARDILNKLLDPSKVINEQFASYLFTMSDGSVIGGQITDENHFLVTLVVDPLNGTKENIPKNGIKKREMSPVSLMPPGLLFTLTPEEVLDLLAYLQSGGDAKSPAFAESMSALHA